MKPAKISIDNGETPPLSKEALARKGIIIDGVNIVDARRVDQQYTGKDDKNPLLRILHLVANLGLRKTVMKKWKTVFVRKRKPGTVKNMVSDLARAALYMRHQFEHD